MLYYYFLCLFLLNYFYSLWIVLMRMLRLFFFNLLEIIIVIRMYDVRTKGI